MSKLLARLRQDYPRHNCISTFEAAIPAYAIQMTFEVLQPHELTTFQRYLLELLSLDVNEPDALAYYLGVGKEVLTSPTTTLLQQRLVEQRGTPSTTGEYPLFLTPGGQEAVVKHGPPPVPTRTTGRFLFNALTESMLSSEEEALYPDMVQGLYVLPAKEESRPRLSTFLEKDQGVKEVLADAPAFKNATIVSFLQLREVSSRYFAPVTVVVLEHRETREQRVAVYRKETKQRQETDQLQFLLDSGKFAIPVMGDAPFFQRQDIHIPTLTLPEETVQEIRNVMENELQRGEYAIQVEEHTMRKSATQDERERQEVEARLQDLQKEVQTRESIIRELRQQLRQSQVEFVFARQHRERLLQAVDQAKERLIILSSWINQEACNEDLCERLARALARGVQLHIGYSLGKDRNHGNTAYYRHNVEEVVKTIKRHLGRMKPAPRINMQKVIVRCRVANQNILICDSQFGITGSFHWLASTGEKQGYELSVLFRHNDQIQELADVALRTWNENSGGK
jgi:hypothetical protein